jgi:DNA-binding CsgD family transcriptional regulator
VLALVAQDRSHRLTGRELGLSKNTVADIVKRNHRRLELRLQLVLLCLLVRHQRLIPPARCGEGSGGNGSRRCQERA